MFNKVTTDFIHETQISALRYVCDNMVDATLKTNDEVSIDDRVGKFFINKDCICVWKNNDRNIRYYGGFQYIDQEYRQEIGDFVFYFKGNERVDRIINQYYDLETEGEN